MLVHVGAAFVSLFWFVSTTCEEEANMQCLLTVGPSDKNTTSKIPTLGTPELDLGSFLEFVVAMP